MTTGSPIVSVKFHFQPSLPIYLKVLSITLICSLTLTLTKWSLPLKFSCQVFLFFYIPSCPLTVTRASAVMVQAVFIAWPNNVTLTCRNKSRRVFYHVPILRLHGAQPCFGYKLSCTLLYFLSCPVFMSFFQGPLYFTVESMAVYF